MITISIKVIKAIVLEALIEFEVPVADNEAVSDILKLLPEGTSELIRIHEAIIEL